MSHQKELHEAVVKNFGDKLKELKADKERYMNKVLGVSAPSQVDRNSPRTHLDESLYQTPNMKNEGKQMNRASGSATMA